MTIQDKLKEYERLTLETENSTGYIYFTKKDKTWTIGLFNNKKKFKAQTFEEVLDTIIDYLKNNRFKVSQNENYILPNQKILNNDFIDKSYRKR